MSFGGASSLTGMTLTGAPCWIDLMSSDTDRARSFYADLLGWTAEAPNEAFGGYASFTLDGGKVAGLMANTTGEPDFWTVYLRVDDAEKTIRLATEHGGVSFMDAQPVGSLGVMGMLADPSGASIGLWQPGEHTGIERSGVAGAPAWFELHTRGYDDVLPWYRDVFGWDVSTMADEPGFRYSTLGSGESQAAGVMDASIFGDGPSLWTVYFQVDDADAAFARALSLGATEVLPVEDTPYGRLAELLDPTGARFKLQQPPAAS